MSATVVANPLDPGGYFRADQAFKYYFYHHPHAKEHQSTALQLNNHIKIRDNAFMVLFLPALEDLQFAQLMNVV